MDFLLYLVGLVLNGLIIGALARLAIPGPNPMGIGTTILVGIGGSFLGGLVGALIFGGPSVWSFVLAVVVAALIVWLIERSRSPARRT